MNQILIVEDEQAIAEAIQFSFETEGYVVQHVTTCHEALQELKQRVYCCAVLDVGLPDASGFDLCKQVREFSDVPVIFLTARNDEVDRVVGLEIGADDYIAKPFSPRELIARVKAILRRVSNEPESEVGNSSVLTVDEDTCEICYQGVVLNLTKAEYLLMLALYKQPGRIYSREQLLGSISQDPGSALDRVIDAHVKSIRAKLKIVSPSGVELIQTRRGLGYTLNLPR